MKSAWRLAFVILLLAALQGLAQGPKAALSPSAEWVSTVEAHYLIYPGVSLDPDKLARYYELSKRQATGTWTDDPRRRGSVITQAKW
jgi:hypothetical protein